MATPSSGLRLKELALRLNLKAKEGDPLIYGITEDSRTVKLGDLFVAIKGQGFDGRDFIKAAKEAGAVAVALTEPDLNVGPRLLVADESSFRTVVNQAAREIYNQPDRALDLVGVTGTNAKSTICYLLEEIFLASGQKTGVMGTINYRWPKVIRPAPNTTPEGPLFWRTLFDMAKDACQVVVMEVSSHALELGRVAGARFTQALFSNLTQDHLDFHGEMESYFQAKRKLFVLGLRDDGKVRAAVGIDDPYGLRLKEELSQRAYGYGLSLKAEVRGENLRLSLSGLKMTIRSPFGDWEQTSPLIGAFNAQNLLGAATIAGLRGVAVPVIQAALAKARGAPGRLEKVASPANTLVLVDYAHSPGALLTVLRALRDLKPRRLLTIFGCGGDRDRTKRPLMGEAAGSLADIAILTSDNPRTEDPLAIIQETRVGLEKVGSPFLEASMAKTAVKGYLIEPDRQKALNLGALILTKGDILLVAGKGHEDYQIINREKKPFDDRVIMAAALADIGFKSNGATL